MNIVFVSRLYLPHLGGVEIHIKELSTILQRMGHKITIVTLQHEKKLGEQIEYSGVQVIRIPNVVDGDKKNTWVAIKKIQQVFIDADIVHVHDVFWWILPIYLKIQHKIYTTFHGWETQYPISINAKIHRYIVSKLSVGTIHVGKYINKFYWDKPDYVTFGGINPKRFTKSNLHSKPEQKLRSTVLTSNSQQQVKFTFIGRLEKDVDILSYIDFLKNLEEKKVKFSVTWVGDGSLRSECQKIGTVTGFVKNVSQYIVNSDFVFATSYLSILEAQCLGKIVLGLYSNSLKKEYLETFPGVKHMLISATPNGLLKKIEHVLRSRKLQTQMQNSARQFAINQTWNKVVAIYMQLWSGQRN